MTVRDGLRLAYTPQGVYPTPGPDDKPPKLPCLQSIYFANHGLQRSDQRLSRRKCRAERTLRDRPSLPASQFSQVGDEVAGLIGMSVLRLEDLPEVGGDHRQRRQRAAGAA